MFYKWETIVQINSPSLKKRGNIPATHFVYDKLIFTHLNVDPNLKNPQKIKILKIKMCSESKSVHNI